MNTILHRSRLPRLLSSVTGIACLLATTALPAQALQLTSSSSTNQGGVLYTFRTVFPVSQLRFGLELTGTPNITALLGPAGYITNASQENSWMLGGGLNAGWNFPLQGNLSVTPFLGYYYMAALTENYSNGI